MGIGRAKLHGRRCIGNAAKRRSTRATGDAKQLQMTMPVYNHRRLRADLLTSRARGHRTKGWSGSYRADFLPSPFMGKYKQTRAGDVETKPVGTIRFREVGEQDASRNTLPCSSDTNSPTSLHLNQEFIHSDSTPDSQLRSHDFCRTLASLAN